jgi:hypothetical protein
VGAAAAYLVPLAPGFAKTNPSATDLADGIYATCSCPSITIQFSKNLACRPVCQNRSSPPLGRSRTLNRITEPLAERQENIAQALRSKHSLEKLSSVFRLTPSEMNPDFTRLQLRFTSPSFWWAWVDSNYRPHPYQGCALTT